LKREYSAEGAEQAKITLEEAANKMRSTGKTCSSRAQND
jgi:hypothetical protein